MTVDTKWMLLHNLLSAGTLNIISFGIYGFVTIIHYGGIFLPLRKVGDRLSGDKKAKVVAKRLSKALRLSNRGKRRMLMHETGQFVC
jgi:hypothetical protein